MPVTLHHHYHKHLFVCLSITVNTHGCESNAYCWWKSDWDHGADLWGIEWILLRKLSYRVRNDCLFKFNGDENFKLWNLRRFNCICDASKWFWFIWGLKYLKIHLQNFFYKFSPSNFPLFIFNLKKLNFISLNLTILEKARTILWTP